MVRKSMTMKPMAALCMVLLLAWAGYAAQQATEQRGALRPDLEVQAKAATDAIRQSDPSLERFFDTSVAYAVFPDVGKAGLIIGGARGHGVVYAKVLDKNGQPQKDDQGRWMWDAVGYCTMTQATIGPQIGGQKYYEVIFFQNDAALQLFKQGGTELSSQASAVAVSAGTAITADYLEGVAVFTQPRSGLMLEASIGGQRFSYEAKVSPAAK